MREGVKPSLFSIRIRRNQLIREGKRDYCIAGNIREKTSIDYRSESAKIGSETLVWFRRLSDIKNSWSGESK